MLPFGASAERFSVNVTLVVAHPGVGRNVMSEPSPTEKSSVGTVAVGDQAERRPGQDRTAQPPDADALDQVLGRELPGYWALVAVHVKEFAALDDRAAVKARCALAGRLDEILNDQAAVYQTASGVAVLVGPAEDLGRTRVGASLLKKAASHHLAGVGLQHLGIPAPTYEVDALADELRSLRGRVREFG